MQVAQPSVDFSRHTSDHAHRFVSARMRPEKSLRTTGSGTNNLVVFMHRQLPAKPMLTIHAESSSSAAQASAASSTINQQVSTASAANNEQRDLGVHKPQPSATPAISGLWESNHVKVLTGTAVLAIGVTWLVLKSTTPELAIQEPAGNSVQAEGNAGMATPSTTLSANTGESPTAYGSEPTGKDVEVLPLTATKSYTRPEEEYLEEINWLQNQNRLLKDEVETLTLETLDLNRELLDLELQLANQSQAIEANTKERIVYNFVDVPLGKSTNSVPVDSAPEGSVSESHEPEDSVSVRHEPQYLSDTALSYDPDTGFYLYGQVHDFGEASVEYRTGDKTTE